jgi:hypothetical protein
MTYVNTTGKNIGQCLTGFAVSYPLTIYNSGNSQVQYDFDNSNDTNFTLSQSSLLLDSSDYGNVDIYYVPTISAPSGAQSTTITINSESTEDGSIDPSGSIEIKITGNKIIDITGGYVRSFKAVRNYDIEKGLNYDFYWSVPTGTENLNNYFFTGYNLDISTDLAFSSVVFSKNINISKNTNAFPIYGDFYGTDQNLNYTNVSNTDYPFLIETDYYARMYTMSVGHSGINIYATGVDSASTRLSDEVISGYSGIPKNIKFTTAPLVVNLNQGSNIQNFDLFKYIVDANYGKSDLSYFSSVDIYLPENTSFSSTSSSEYALKLDGTFENFTGVVGQNTFINIYIPETTTLLGSKGEGGQIRNQDLNNPQPESVDIESVINNALAAYAGATQFNNASYHDSKSGGNVIKLAAKTKLSGVDRSDIVYNLYIQNKTSLLSGGGGSKAAVVMTKHTLGTFSKIIAGNNTSSYQNGNFVIQGSTNSSNTKLPMGIVTALDYGVNNNAVYYNYTQTSQVGYWFSPEAGYGESGSQTVGYFIFNKNFPNRESSVFYTLEESITLKNKIGYNKGFDFAAFVIPVNKISTNQICGKLITSLLNSSVILKTYNTNLPSDYIFRFPNSGISSSPNYWVGGSYTLTGAATYSANYKSFGYKALTLKNQFLSTIFTDSVLCSDFDLYIVAAIEEDTVFNTLADNSTSFKFLDWYRTQENVSSKHILYTKYPATSYNYYPKEPNVFQLFSTLLFDAQNVNTSDFFKYDVTNTVKTNFSQISKSLNSAEQTYYPVIINIKRSKSVYFIFVNGVLLTSYDLLNLTPVVGRSSSLLINDIKGTTFKLINDLTSLKVSYFDIACYNRLLNQSEQVNINNYFIDSYFKLFIGENSSSYDIKNKNFRLPNIFNLAGTSSQINI